MARYYRGIYRGHKEMTLHFLMDNGDFGRMVARKVHLVDITGKSDSYQGYTIIEKNL